MKHTVVEEILYYPPSARRSYDEGGHWPFTSHHGFVEAFVCAHFIRRGYEAFSSYNLVGERSRSPIIAGHQQIARGVIGEEASAYLKSGGEKLSRKGGGQPDVFVCRRDVSADPKARYPDDRLWFFVEVKEERDHVQENQKRFWRMVADRPDLGLGPDRIRVARLIPEGAQYTPVVIDY